MRRSSSRDGSTRSTGRVGSGIFWRARRTRHANHTKAGVNRLRARPGLAPRRQTDARQSWSLACRNRRLVLGGYETVNCRINPALHTCSWEQFPPSVPARAQQVIAACNRVHEQTHYDDVKCACDDCISRPPFSKGKNQKREECAGYRASLACDIARQSQCGGDPACLAALQEDMKTLQRQIRKFCGR